MTGPPAADAPPPPPPDLLAVDLTKRDQPGPHDTPELLQARLDEERRRALDNALTVD